MIHDLKPYPVMKDSDLPWLGKVPEHWAIKRGKNLFHCVDVRTETGKEELLTVSSERGIIPRRSTTVTMFKAESYIGHKLCWPGDLVINSLWAWSRGLGVSRHHGIVSTAYGVYRPRTGLDVDPRFIHELVRSKPFHWELQVRSKGVWTSRLQLTDDSFLGAPFPLPPLPEQAAIVRFLDHMDRRIRKYIRAKQKLIKLLEEQKQAIIHRAVTRGLDPNVRLKPSGVEWMGDVPAHWEVRRLKSIAQIRYGLGQPPRESKTGLPLIRATNVDHGRILEKNLVRVDPEDVPKTRNAFLSEGEIIIVRSGAYTADSAIIPREYAGAVTGYDMVVTPRKVRPGFIALALLSSYIRDDQLIIASTRSAQPHLNAEELGVALVMLPPEAEQERIVTHVMSTDRMLDTAAQTAHSEISLLREYRTRLIADVVTGKLDVREVAANLPEEAEEPEVLDEIEAIENGEEMMIEGEGASELQEAEA